MNDKTAVFIRHSDKSVLDALRAAVGRQDVFLVIPKAEQIEESWSQPLTSEITIDETHALMSQQTFEQLQEYSTSIPSGVYDGKMWRAQTQRRNRIVWLLRWYDRSDSPMCSSLKSREILIA